MILNDEQQKIHNCAIDFVHSHLPLLTIGGYAGTGKTVTIGKISETLHAEGLRIAFCAYTGKASHVLKGKISLGPRDYCGTIHGLMYKLIEKRGRKLIWEKVESIDYDLIILE
jgi:hypothetical protein